VEAADESPVLVAHPRDRVEGLEHHTAGALVCSEPLRALSSRFGISDVALKKTCARVRIRTISKTDSLMGQAIGRRYSAVIGFANDADAKRAATLIKKAAGRK